MKIVRNLLFITGFLFFVTDALGAFTFSGQAEADLAFKYMLYDKKQDDGKTYYTKIGAPSEYTALELNAAATEGKLNSEWVVRINAYGPAVETGWVSYDFGMTTLKYSAVGLCYRWNEYVPFFDKADGSAFDLTVADIAYFTVMGLAGEMNGDFQDTDARYLPVISTGIDYKITRFSIACGAVVDINPASKTEKQFTEDSDYDGINDSNPLQAEGYNGYMGFLNTEVDLNPISIKGACSYGRSVGNITDSDELRGKNSSGLGTMFGLAFTMGQIEFGDTFYLSIADKAANNNGNTVTSITYADAYVQYKIDNNFYVKPYVTVSKYDMEDNNKGSYWDATIAVRTGFAW